MALPSGITTATVTFGTSTDFAGDPVTTKLKIVPSATIFWSGTNAPVVAFAINAESDTEGSVVLPHTDQPGFVDINGAPILHWSYIATGEWRSPAGGSVLFRKEFLLPSTATTVDFDMMPGGAIGTTNPPSTVGPQGPPGPPGPVPSTPFVILTQAEYDALAIKNPSTVYAIKP